VPTVTTQKIWDNHPYPGDPCDKSTFTNQCAIRMGVALAGAGLSLVSFQGAKCWLQHNPPHILRAQELANWLVAQTATVGTVRKHKTKVSNLDFVGKKGIVFIKDGWGATDHIDIWNGSQLKGGSPTYFALGKEVWFWELP